MKPLYTEYMDLFELHRTWVYEIPIINKSNDYKQNLNILNLPYSELEKISLGISRNTTYDINKDKNIIIELLETGIEYKNVFIVTKCNGRNMYSLMFIAISSNFMYIVKPIYDLGIRIGTKNILNYMGVTESYFERNEITSSVILLNDNIEDKKIIVETGELTNTYGDLIMMYYKFNPELLYTDYNTNLIKLKMLSIL